MITNGRIHSKKLTSFSFFGPTCDSLDYMKGPFLLPNNIKEGDYIELGQLGAYGLTFRTKFNGFYSNEIFELMINQSCLYMITQVKLITWLLDEKKNSPNIGHNKKSFLNSPVEHIDIASFDARKIIEGMGKMSFTSRDTANAAKIFNEMISDESCSIFLQLQALLLPEVV